MKELGDVMNTVAEKTGRTVLSIAIEVAKEADGLTQCSLLEAAVEIAEPTKAAERQDNNQRAG
jgi:hypothetical protein